MFRQENKTVLTHAFHFGFCTCKAKCIDLIPTEIVIKSVAVNGSAKSYPKLNKTVSSVQWEKGNLERAL